MNDRNLYRGLNNFEGSIDEDGKLYDERHRLVGRIEGKDVYDTCNIKQGSIDENGKLWDINHSYVGQAHGNNFVGPTYQSTGMVRGDSLGEGDGCEYGALMMLKKRNEQYSGKILDNDYNFPNNNDDEDEENEDFDDNIDDESNTDDDWGINDRQSGRMTYENEDVSDIAGCVSSLITVIIVVILVWIALSYAA